MSTGPREGGRPGGSGHAASRLSRRPPPPPQCLPRSRRPRTWRPPACVAAARVELRRWGRTPGDLGGRRQPPRLGEGACARGACARGGVAVPARRHVGPHPTPVVHCCFRGGGPAAKPRGVRVPPLPHLPVRVSAPVAGAVTPSGPARRWAAAAGAPGYEWSGAGLEPASGDSWEEAGFLRAEGEVGGGGCGERGPPLLEES